MDTTFFNFREGLRGFLLGLNHVVYDSILYDPLEKVELGDSRRETVEFDAIRATEGIEELFGVPVETRLVGNMNREHLAVRTYIRHVLVL
jgi:hypothetical protein